MSGAGRRPAAGSAALAARCTDTVEGNRLPLSPLQACPGLHPHLVVGMPSTISLAQL